MTKKAKLIRILPALLFALIAGKYLFLPPIHGIADNGDFWRVMAPAGISYEEGKIPPRYRAFTSEFSLSKPNLGSATTSAVLPAYLAAKISFSPEFDLRTLAALYLIVFTTGLAALSLCFTGWAFALGFAWMALEPSFFLHFNSFFSQSLSLALWPWLLWALVKTLRERRKYSGVLLGIFALLIATSKLQLLLLPLLLLIVINLPPRRKQLFTSTILGLAFAVSLVLSFLPTTAEKRGLTVMNRYQATFTGISPVAPDPVAALSALGIPPQFHYLNNLSMMEPPVNGMIAPELAGILMDLSLFRIGWVYLTSPASIWNSIPRFQTAIARTPLQYLGNFELKADLPGKTLEPWWQYSNVRDFIFRLVPWLPWILTLALVFYFGWLAKQRVKFEPWHCLALFLFLDFLSQLPISVIGDGFFSIHRHLLSARLSLDLLILLLIDRAIAQRRNLLQPR